MPEEGGLHRLSLSETRVARLVAAGLSDEEVAKRLAISVVAVSVELAEVLRKLGLRSRTELALLAPDGSEPRRRSPGDPGASQGSRG